MTSSKVIASAVGLSTIAFYFIRWILSNFRKTSVKNKVVLITGASSGLGEVCAHVFFKAGAKVILCARRQEELERVKSELLNLKSVSNSTTPKVLVLNLSDLTNIPTKAREAWEFYEKIDILINNGGIGYRGEAQSTSLDVDQKIMMVNYFGQVALTKAILPKMISVKSGHILAVSSIQGKIAIPNRSSYAASKHALQGFFDSLRAEVAVHNIYVTVISPSYIQTNLSVNAITGDGSQYGVMDSMTQNGKTPEYVANCILKSVIYHQREVIVASLPHKLAVILRNILPNVFFWLMDKRAKKYKRL